MRTTKIVCCTALGSLFLLAVACKQKQKQQSPDDKLPITMEIVEKAGGGWEYDIYVDHKIYIKQDRIPAINATQGFATKADAEKTAKAVVEKMKKGIFPPALSEQELKNLSIQLPIVK
jgi:hypothetical protein